ncbi:MAG TPA: exodeoxyribonuclease VII small subunit [Thiotrichales bacterium]|nr:exodeoxyribonuclease VII small subunit [Thiotrichales bacterium]
MPGKTPDFEKTLEELEAIVARLEAGELSLEESLQAFERGVALTRSCQKALEAAEQKVEKLLSETGTTVPFEPDAQADD